MSSVQMFIKRSVEGSTLWVLVEQQTELGLNLKYFRGILQQNQNVWAMRTIFIFNLFSRKHTCITTLSFPRGTHMKVGGDKWLISVEWRGRRELNELSLFWGLCMRIHCYIFTVASEKIWVSLWLRFSVSSLLRFPSLLKGKSAANISCTQQSRQTTVCFLFISVQFTFNFQTCKYTNLHE